MLGGAFCAYLEMALFAVWSLVILSVVIYFNLQREEGYEYVSDNWILKILATSFLHYFSNHKSLGSRIVDASGFKKILMPHSLR